MTQQLEATFASAGVTSHCTLMDATPLLIDVESTHYRSCVSALQDFVLDRADAQLEASTLGSLLKAVTTGAMEALCRVTRGLLDARDVYVKRTLKDNDPLLLDLT